MKKVISYSLSIVLSIILVIAILIVIAQNTVFNYNFMLKVLDETDYYSLLKTNIDSNVEGYIKQSGLDKEVFENIYSKEQIKSDFTKVLDSIYNNTSADLDTDTVRNKLENNINIFLEENSVSLNNNERKNIDDYIDEIVSIYSKEILHPVYLDAVQKNITKLIIISSQIDKYLFIAIIAVVGGILLINRELKETVKYFAISILTAAFFIVIVIGIIKFRIKLDYLVILNSSFSLLIIYGIKKIINKIIYTSIILICFSIVLLLLSLQKKRKKDKIRKNY